MREDHHKRVRRQLAQDRQRYIAMAKSVDRDRFERACRILHRLKLEGMHDDDVVQISIGTARDLIVILDIMSTQNFEQVRYNVSQDVLREALAEHGVTLASSEFARINGEPVWLVTCKTSAGAVLTVRVSTGPIEHVVSEVLKKLDPEERARVHFGWPPKEKT